MLPKKGKMLHPWNGLAKSAKDYAELIAEALRLEHDDTHRSVKTIMRWTGASERSVKNWLSGEMGPSGYFLMRLCAQSLAARELVLEHLTELEVGFPPNIGAEFGSEIPDTILAPSAPIPLQPTGRAHANGDTNGDIIGDMHVTNNVPLNERQAWLLGRVASGDRCTFDDIVARWLVSDRTAKRDIAELKGRGLIRYSGSHRRGFYVAVDDALP
ncbi:DeoR family transcriptional regulator [Novosphingobium percolationis]|uniref:DeoR family transcriptional regulator n=1 Tax=Novosphingobium percolationis TaxID=2871811 RepID=UPI001CD21E13|nr:DeoR family transcriptional regulator [Novosphingobium percolationis]